MDSASTVVASGIVSSLLALKSALSGCNIIIKRRFCFFMSVLFSGLQQEVNVFMLSVFALL